MDELGDHAVDLCPAGFGRTHRHNAVRNAVASRVARAAGLDCQYEVPLLVPRTALRPAGILVLPPLAPDGSESRPIACDITVVSPFKPAVRTQATQAAGDAAVAAHRDKVTALKRNLSHRLLPPSDTPAAEPHFDFQPVAFDSLGVPSASTLRFINGLVPCIAQKPHASQDAIRQRIFQQISCAL